MTFFLKVMACFFSYVLLESKTIVITGGAGFIGATVTQNLLKRGDSVIVIDAFLSLDSINGDRYNAMKRERIFTLQQQFPDTLHFYECNIEDKETLRAIFSKYQIDAVCHLAAHAGVRFSMQFPNEVAKTNIEGTINILELMKDYKVKHGVLASSSSVYGNTTQIPFTENQPTDMQSSLYGATKKSLELIAYAYHNLYDLSLTCLRFFTVYGPYGRFDMSPFIFMDAIYHEKPITIYGDGSAIRDFTYIDDIIQGIIKAIDKPAGYQKLNLGAGRTITIKEFISLIGDIVGKEPIISFQESFAADVNMTQASITKAQNLLNYNPQYTVRSGIKLMYEWYKEYENKKNSTVTV